MYILGLTFTQGLKNKSIYLDTNILFRAIGINGEFRKSRTISFLEKCIAAGERLMISKFTEDEFKNTIHSKIEQEVKRFSSNYDMKLYKNYANNHALFLYYLSWKNKILI